jgi:hypothetical protein
MRALLVRVGADQSEGGGHYNGPVDTKTRDFAYVPIPETAPIHPHLAKPYTLTLSRLNSFGASLPYHLAGANMHLDPDFDHLTYGDQGQRAIQIRSKVTKGDLLVFYAGMRDVHPAPRLVYALVGIYMVEGIVLAATIPKIRWHENAHTRRKLCSGAGDIVVRAKSGVSGRLQRCIPIGDYRDRAYRVWPSLLKAWGGLSVNDGYLQRSARLPEFYDACRFYDWFLQRGNFLLTKNS